MEHYTIVILIGLNCGASDPDCSNQMQSATRTEIVTSTSNKFIEQPTNLLSEENYENKNLNSP